MPLQVQRLEWTMQKVNRRRSEQAWRELVARQAQSGLSVAAFCQREGISAWSLYDWRKRLGSGADTKKALVIAPTEQEPETGFIDLGALGRTGGARCEIRLDLGGGVVLHLVRS
jgi:transposase-like protein